MLFIILLCFATIIFPFPTAGRCIDLFGRQCYLRRNIVLHLEYDLNRTVKAVRQTKGPLQKSGQQS